MAFELLLAPRRHNQVSHLGRQEAPQPAHAFDFANLVGDALFVFGLRLQLARSFAQFVEQPRVLDGNDRLGGEVLDEFDLLLNRRTSWRAREKRTNKFVVP
jgi:hypothetical protein